MIKSIIKRNVVSLDPTTPINPIIYYKTKKKRDLVMKNSYLPPTGPLQEVNVVYEYAGTSSLGSKPNEIKVTRLEVPRYTIMGTDAKLMCEYDNQSKDIYSIKWYRNDREFFHHIPTNEPPKRHFSMPGINVDIHNSNGTIVILKNVSMASGGRYKCEVSAEWPQYTTADKSSTMEVVVIPKSKPIIYGAEHEYRLGDSVRVTCMSEPSKPKARLTWYINNVEAKRENLEPRMSTDPLPHNSGPRGSKLTLKFRVTPNHFVNGKLTLRCSAKISPQFIAPHLENSEITFNVPMMNENEIGGFSGFSGGCGNYGKQENRLRTSIVIVTGIVIQNRWQL